MQSPDELKRENKTLRDRISTLSAAILRISESLDVSTVLDEVVQSACALTGARYGTIMTLDEMGQVQEYTTPGRSRTWPRSSGSFASSTIRPIKCGA